MILFPGKSLHKVISRNHVDHSCVSWLKNCIWVKAMVILPSLRDDHPPPLGIYCNPTLTMAHVQSPKKTSLVNVATCGHCSAAGILKMCHAK